MTQDKDKFRADFEAWYFERCKHANPLPLNDWTFEQFKPVCMAPDGDTYKVDSARDYWQAWQAARASVQQGVPEPGWWRKRADEIELEVARTGSTDAMRCYTDMRTLLQSVAAPQQVACGCAACTPLSLENMRMILCAKCGNKRCPHATDHRNACTRSNEPGQKGSSYEHAGLGAAMAAKESQ